MSRLIDADAVILNYGGLVHISPYDFQGIVKYFAEQISAAPTIDAVPVVRCRECYYWESGENSCEKWEYCNFHRIGIGPHGFCSYGERKEEEQDNE